MFFFKVRSRRFESPTQLVTGEQVLEIANLIPPDDYELYLRLQGREFEPVQLSETIDLGDPGIEQFSIRRRTEIPYYLDGELFSSYECFITPEEILNANGYTPEKFYLKEIVGHKEISFKNDLDHLISLRPNAKFITCKMSPTPVS